MGIRRLFVIWTFILLALNGAFLYFLWEGFSFLRLVLLEGLVVGAFLFLGYFYRQVIRPLDAIGNGIDFLKEQDFSSRLRKTGQRETDRIVELFNKMIARLKEERLRSEERNRFLDLLVQASPMGIILLDGDGRIMSLNPSALRFLEVSSETSLVGKRLVDSEEPLLVALGGIPLGESTSIRMSDARIYQGSAAFFMNRGVQRRFFMVEELTREMFEIERKAYEKVIRMIAHEVNNTVAGVVATLDTLHMLFGDNQEENRDIQEATQVAIDRCFSLNRFITRFADVVRIPEPQLVPSVLNLIVLNCTHFMESICRSRQIEIKLDLSDDLPLIPLDASLLEQAVINILKNGVEAIGECGTLFVRTRKDPVRLEIMDTGHGLSSDVERQLFSPFFSTKPNGQGLGLMLVREILRKHHCVFSLRKGESGMTTFCVKFG